MGLKLGDRLDIMITMQQVQGAATYVLADFKHLGGTIGVSRCV